MLMDFNSIPTSKDARQPRSDHRRTRLQTVLGGYADQQRRDDLGSRVEEKTDLQRQRIWALWLDFFHRIMDDIIDPAQIWIDLCLCKPEAQDYCQLFLHNYAEEGTEYMVSLNDEGFDEVPTVASAKTVLDAWRDLIVHADKTILRDKRAEDPARAAQWTLRLPVKDTGRANGSPLSQISRWIAEDLAPQQGLSLTQTFEKREATSDDVLLILSTLWGRSRDIILEPRLRISFHGILLLSAMGGFRIGVVKDLKYRQCYCYIWLCSFLIVLRSSI
ncbi:hypothetical protein M406DRAFT_330180 [Cryphonectria parasitica EP155]|uniref:Uncharacterized protein n=1 Tax=Cryphonectria parasitica (strain ATCC 38755 / EP155) TaxID=660469 RepID=A0A9P5CQR6_CRYP1|nr:uncharacterized protein M406DRAFT_330180 [Cryphonectria parasitica EP155]KAF3766355.1 hypothetical protein M406DRAFT_330180 [Cryphonectria parasitica EP155]